MTGNQTICVYCSSSNDVNAAYYSAAEDLGRLLAEQSFPLVYGGGGVGLMGAVARAVHEHGGSVTGVIPEALTEIEGVAYDSADEMIVTDTMQERKAAMYERADAFVVLPGGFGTLEEFLEVLTLKRLGYHDRPIVLVNVEGFFDPLLELFDHFYDEGMATRSWDSGKGRAASPRRQSYFVAEDVGSAVAYLASHVSMA